MMDCWVTGSMGVDVSLFSCWVQGIPHLDAARRREILLDLPPGLPDTRRRTIKELNFAECAEQYQIFEWLTPYLNTPHLLSAQSVFQLGQAQASELIQLYYSMDDNVVRALLGKLLSKALRRDIDEIATATRTHLCSARRQFDNLKRVLKHVEQSIARARADGLARRTILNIIVEDFLLPVELASHYLHAVFLCVNRVETNKGRLAALDLTQWNSVAGVALAMWGEERCAAAAAPSSPSRSISSPPRASPPLLVGERAEMAPLYKKVPSYKSVPSWPHLLSLAAAPWVPS
jgi:hypothetical protein